LFFPFAFFFYPTPGVNSPLNFHEEKDDSLFLRAPGIVPTLCKGVPPSFFPMNSLRCSFLVRILAPPPSRLMKTRDRPSFLSFHMVSTIFPSSFLVVCFFELSKVKLFFSLSTMPEPIAGVLPFHLICSAARLDLSLFISLFFRVVGSPFFRRGVFPLRGKRFFYLNDSALGDTHTPFYFDSP